MNWILEQLKTISRWWELQAPGLEAKGPAGTALVALAKRYLTPPATSTAVERLFSAAGLIMDSKRNKLCPTFVDKLLFLREAHLLGVCQLSWK